MFLSQPENRLCVMCLAEDKHNVVVARVADHIIPHKGDPYLFWFGALQGLCRQHHNRSKQQLEVKGYTDDIGADGYPLDKKHPFWTGTLSRKSS